VDTDSADVIWSPGTPLDRDVPTVTPGAAESACSVTELFTEHHLGLIRLALLMVGDLATAEDVVQDAFEQLHRRWRSLRAPSSALDYARAAVLNGCRSVLLPITSRSRAPPPGWKRWCATPRAGP
jgi:hypothetical protein